MARIYNGTRREGVGVIKSLFGRKKKKLTGATSLAEGVRDAVVGDVFTIMGFDVEYDDGYYLIEAKHRYATSYSTWYELEAGDGDRRLWVYWSNDGGQLFTSATNNNEPVPLDALNLTRDDLTQVDEEHSLSNYFTYEGRDFYYLNSGEAFFFEGGQGDGIGYYTWDLMSSDERTVLSIDKFSGRPYECYFSSVVSPDSITVYKQ